MKRKSSFLWRLFKAAPVFLLTLVLTLLFAQEGGLRDLETTALDVQMYLLNNTTQPESDVVVVQITDQDYQNLFHGQSPIDPNALKQIINAIALGRPKVIGVDIDTAPEQFQVLAPEAEWPSVVWGRPADYSNIKKRFHVQQFLGGKHPELLSGLVVMENDQDGAVRLYSRNYPTDTPGGSLPSFPHLLARQFKPDLFAHAARIDDQQPMFVKYSGNRREARFLHIDAGKVLEFARGADWPNDNLLKDKIVILGGAYGATDEHDTPLRWMNGVEILAYATQTELQGGGLKPVSRGIVFLLQMIDGILLLLLFQHFRITKAIIFSLVAIPILSFICSLIVFHSLGFWAYFMPILVALICQQLYERAKEYRTQLLTQIYGGVDETDEAKLKVQKKSKVRDKLKRPQKHRVS